MVSRPQDSSDVGRGARIKVTLACSHISVVRVYKFAFYGYSALPQHSKEHFFKKIFATQVSQKAQGKVTHFGCVVKGL